MFSLLLVSVTALGPGAARADQPFVAARNISARLESQGNRVGGCAQVTIFTATRRSLDGDHEYLGVNGVKSTGAPFQFAEEFGRTIGYMPRVRRNSDDTFGVYTFRRFPFEFDVRGLRHYIVTLVVDPAGVITDLVAPDGERLCRGVAAEAPETPAAPAPVPVPDDEEKPGLPGRAPADSPARPGKPGLWM